MRRFEPVLFGLLALLLYWLLGADAFYKVDGIDIVRLLQEHGEHPWHVGFLPALAGFARLLGMLGIEPDPLRLGALFSAFGAAIGVGFVRAGIDRLGPPPLGMTPAMARFTTAVFATCPITLTFATVVEFHGPMLAPLGLAFWWTCVQLRQPSFRGMALLGALCHLPFLLHSQQLFLPVWLLAFFVLKRGLTRKNVALAVTAGAVHAALLLVLPRVFPGFYGYWADLSAGFSTEASIGRPQSLDYTAEILVQEWIWPWLPFSLLVFLAPFRKALRPEFAAFLLGFLPYLYLSVRQLVHEPEFGAYMLPMVLPAAMLIGRRLGGHPAVWIMLVFHFVMWGRGPREHLQEQWRIDESFAERVAESAAGRSPFVLVGSHRELGSAYARLPLPEFLWVRPNATLPRAQATPQQFAGIEFYLRRLLQEDRAVLITEGALRSLDDPHGAMLAEKATLAVPENSELAGPLFADHLRAEFGIPCRADRAWPLVPRSRCVRTSRGGAGGGVSPRGEDWRIGTP
ncbi:MAG: hypothetical protein KDE27_29115, partial [Planctomycetes bacterium]|nr:hypothetical protein [Planctomycetota bacterium]